MLCVDAGFHIEDKKGLVSRDSSTVEMENFDPDPRSKEPLIPSMPKICEVNCSCWRGMVIDAGKRMVILNEGQGDCVTLRRACWTAWPPGSL